MPTFEVFLARIATLRRRRTCYATLGSNRRPESGSEQLGVWNAFHKCGTPSLSVPEQGYGSLDGFADIGVLEGLAYEVADAAGLYPFLHNAVIFLDVA